MDKGIITLSVDKNATQDDIKAIREQFKKDNPNYKLNIVVSGEQDMKLSLSNFIMARLKP